MITCVIRVPILVSPDAPLAVTLYGRHRKLQRRLYGPLTGAPTGDTVNGYIERRERATIVWLSSRPRKEVID